MNNGVGYGERPRLASPASSASLITYALVTATSAPSRSRRLLSAAGGRTDDEQQQDQHQDRDDWMPWPSSERQGLSSTSLCQQQQVARRLTRTSETPFTPRPAAALEFSTDTVADDRRSIPSGAPIRGPRPEPGDRYQPTRDDGARRLADDDLAASPSQRRPASLRRKRLPRAAQLVDHAAAHDELTRSSSVTSSSGLLATAMMSASLPGSSCRACRHGPAGGRIDRRSPDRGAGVMPA